MGTFGTIRTKIERNSICSSKELEFKKTNNTKSSGDVFRDYTFNRFVDLNTICKHTSELIIFTVRSISQELLGSESPEEINVEPCSEHVPLIYTYTSRAIM